MAERGADELGWLVLLDVPQLGAVPVTDARTARQCGQLLLVRGRAKPHRAAVRIDPGLIADGPPLAISLVLSPQASRPLFDDPAVVEAMRTVLRQLDRAPLFSTLVDGPARWAGAISGVDATLANRRPAWWDEDPFARIGPQHRIIVPAGVLRPVPLPSGPSHQRHAGAPWPWGRFPSAAVG